MKLPDSRETDRDMHSEGDVDISSLDDTDQVDITPVAKTILLSSKASKKACLVVLRGIDLGSVIPINNDSIVIGRSPLCDAQMNEDSVSREHVRVSLQDSDEVMVEDLGSTNGTFVEGKRISSATLKPGERLLLGRQTVLKFVIQDKLDRLYQQEIYDSSIRDGLTSVHNRKYIEERMVRDLSYARRHHTPISFLMFDLDHFKQINDTYGHQSGDQVLIAVANAVTDAIRTEDVFGRYGGEEFAVIAPKIDLEGGQTLGERIRARIENEKVIAQDGSGKTIGVTASIGVAAVHPDAIIDSTLVISVADSNLYKAKGNGRNQVVASLIK